MTNTILVSIVLFIIVISVIFQIFLSLKIEKLENKKPPEPAPISIDISGTEARLAKAMSSLPDKIVNSITGSANVEKGKLGELIGYLSMKAEYDRIIPLGNIVDYMGIKLPTDDSPGYVDFIDIKTGKHSRLTSDQRKLKTLLDEKLISFKTIRIDDTQTK